jgi:hypothetical protein
VLLLLVLFAGPPARAADTRAEEGKVGVGVEDWGLGGSLKGGLWSPLYVELKAVGADFDGQLEVVVEAGTQVEPIFVKPVTLVKDTPTQHWLYFRSPGTSWVSRTGRSEFAWQLRDQRGRVVFRSQWERPVVLPATDVVVTVFRTADVGACGLGGLTDTESAVKADVVMVTPATAPDRVVGYQGADVLVWVNPDPTLMASVAQREALVAYVRQGGHLVLAAGSGWQALTESFLAELLPARPVGTALVKEVPALEAYGLGQVATKETLLAQLTDVRGEVLMECEGRPVIVRGPVGAGWVTLIGFDPTKSPFADLAPGLRLKFWATVLGIEVTRRPLEQLGSMARASDALIRPLNDFPDFKPINFPFIILFLIGYILLIGPVDYFVLRRMKKLAWTWVTFPSVAVVASVLAFWLLASERVRGLLANSISIVDASSQSEEVVGTTFTTFLSPRQTRYRVTLSSGAVGAVVPREYEVLGASPGLGFGRSYCLVSGAGEAIDELLVRVWDAQTLEASWRAPKPDLPNVDLTRTAKGLTGTVSNSTADALRDVMVLFAGRAIHLGTLRPGESVVLGPRPSQPLAEFARRCVPSDFWEERQYYSAWGRELHREEVEDAARWASLFAFQEEAGTFRRWVVLRGEESPPGEGRTLPTAVFDLPRQVQLGGVQGTAEAVLLYSVDRSFVGILLSEKQPKSWDRSLVRLRVPVAEGEPKEKGPAGE